MLHAEELLLVDDGESEIVELDLFREGGMRADEDVDLAVFQSFFDLPLFLGLHRGGVGEEGETDRSVLEEEESIPEVLMGEFERRRHQDALLAAERVGVETDEADNRLSRSDIALEKTVHDPFFFHVQDDFADGGELVLGQAVGNGLDDGIDLSVVDGRVPAFLFPVCLSLQKKGTDGIGQGLFVFEDAKSVLELFFRAREVDCPVGILFIEKAIFFLKPSRDGGQEIGGLRGALEHLLQIVGEIACRGRSSEAE